MGLEAPKNHDGSWGWWQGGKADALMTALAIEGLVLAEEAGLMLQRSVIDRGVQAALRMVESAQGEERAALLYALRRRSRRGHEYPVRRVELYDGIDV